MQLPKVTEATASLKGHRDQENLFEWKKATDTAIFKKGRKICGTTVWTASLQSPGKLLYKLLQKLVQVHETAGDGEQPASAHLPRAHSGGPS